MKRVIIIPEGAPDEPLDELDGRTPLQAARLPKLNALAARARLGTAHMFPPNSPPRSEISLLALLGYEPPAEPVGRAAIEARAHGLTLGRRDQAFLCEFVTAEAGRLRSLLTGTLQRAEAEPLMAALNALGADHNLRFEVGHGARNFCIWIDAGPLPKLITVAPQDILDQPLRDHMPSGRGSRTLCDVMKKAEPLLRDHELNAVRRDLGENPASAIWLWGHGVVPRLEVFRERYGLGGVMISGSELARGLARLVRLEAPAVVGATGEMETDLAAKATAALTALEETELVCVHVRAPDAAAHAGLLDAKTRALEAIDEKIVGPLLARLTGEPQWRLLVAPTHGTSVRSRRHLGMAVPLLLAGHDIESNRGEAFDEPNCAAGELQFERGTELMQYFLRC